MPFKLGAKMVPTVAALLSELEPERLEEGLLVYWHPEPNGLWNTDDRACILSMPIEQRLNQVKLGGSKTGHTWQVGMEDVKAAPEEPKAPKIQKGMLEELKAVSAESSNEDTCLLRILLPDEVHQLWRVKWIIKDHGRKY